MYLDIFMLQAAAELEGSQAGSIYSGTMLKYLTWNGLNHQTEYILFTCTFKCCLNVNAAIIAEIWHTGYIITLIVTILLHEYFWIFKS